MGGTVADYGFVAQYVKVRESFRVRTIAVTGVETSQVSGIPDQNVQDFLQGIMRSSGHAVREEAGVRLLRIRTSQGYPLDFEELMPAVGRISDAEWRLGSFIEVRWDEQRAGGPPCVEDVSHGANILARFTETTVSGTLGRREYSHDALSLSLVEAMGSGASAPEYKDKDSARGRCPREYREEPDDRENKSQDERYLELLPQLRRYMIFGDRLVVLTDSLRVLLFQADRPDG